METTQIASKSTKITVDSGWKWAAMDSNGVWYLYTNKPNLAETQWTSIEGCYTQLGVILVFGKNWKDSLHKVENNKLYHAKIVPIPRKNSKVMVSMDGRNWIKRHSAGKVVDGRLLCYTNGGTNWAIETTTKWEYWRKPTKEELKPAK